MYTKFVAGAAVSTPLNSNLLINNALLISHVNDMRSSGIELFTLFGSTGEGASFSRLERNETIEACNAAGLGPEELGSGVFGLSSRSTGKAAADAFS